MTVQVRSGVILARGYLRKTKELQFLAKYPLLGEVSGSVPR